jgi:hypothetical protein
MPAYARRAHRGGDGRYHCRYRAAAEQGAKHHTAALAQPVERLRPADGRPCARQEAGEDRAGGCVNPTARRPPDKNTPRVPIYRETNVSAQTADSAI